MNPRTGSATWRDALNSVKASASFGTMTFRALKYAGHDIPIPVSFFHQAFDRKRNLLLTFRFPFRHEGAWTANHRSFRPHRRISGLPMCPPALRFPASAAAGTNSWTGITARDSSALRVVACAACSSGGDGGSALPTGSPAHTVAFPATDGSAGAGISGPTACTRPATTPASRSRAHPASSPTSPRTPSPR